MNGRLGNLRRHLEYVAVRLRYPQESVDFYRAIQRRKIRHGIAYERGHGVGEAQIDFLRSRDLQPSDRVLDIGCGDLRGGRYIIDYLDAGNYTGMDISPAALGAAHETLSGAGVRHKRPLLVCNDDLRFDEFDRPFDVVFSHSVFTHLPIEYIEECFANLRQILADGGRAYLSYGDVEDTESGWRRSLTRTVGNSNHYRYGFEELKRLGGEYGLSVHYDPYAELPVGNLRMLVIE